MGKQAINFYVAVHKLHFCLSSVCELLITIYSSIRTYTHLVSSSFIAADIVSLNSKYLFVDWKEYGASERCAFPFGASHYGDVSVDEKRLIPK
jgi:hypothetical protein